METFSMKTSVTVNASAEKVWDALTNPELVKQYFFGTNLESTWEVGSPIVFRGEYEGKEYEDKGTIIACEPKKILEFSYWSNFSGLPNTPENQNKITYTLEEKDGKTEVTVTQDNINSEDAKTHSESNWQMVLQGMKERVEKVE